MFKFYNSEKVDILTKTQENLEIIQENLKANQEVLAASLEAYSENQKNTDLLSTILLANTTKQTSSETPKTDIEKLKAAYALNLCTVSVSQIIDYNDIYFLENEYNAILNNLNLEEMPKDEALLRILKQLLDVITFFRIQEGDKKMQEKLYQQKLKDAVWSAVPNPSVILSGGSPVSIAISLASQVGIGYMNYRKEKAKINLEKEQKDWELQRSAIEQFNGLRRELFDTAWRLAEEYEFKDNFRLTENQITQYNNILLDTDNLRRYERLLYISDNFNAYPPFWYYLGSAANAVNQDKNLDNQIREKYKIYAIEHFDKFLQLTESNLLREDQLIASCALEKFDLIEDKEAQINLLKRAAKASGNALDVLQICAVSYLKIGEISECCSLLRMLVNEGYNESLNAQLLSKLYVSRYISGETDCKDDYVTLQSRISRPEILFPIPADLNSNTVILDFEFIKQQKQNLFLDAANTFKLYIEVCEKKYNYLCENSNNITEDMAKFIEEINDNINNFFEPYYPNLFINNLCSSEDVFDKFKNMLEKNDKDIRKKYYIDFNTVFKNPFLQVAKKIVKLIRTANKMDLISSFESTLFDFKINANLSENNITLYQSNISKSSIEDMLFDDGFKQKQATNKKVEEIVNLLEAINISEKTLLKDSSEFEFIKPGDLRFSSYIRDNKKLLSKRNVTTSCIVAILDNKNSSSKDFVFTIDGICYPNSSVIIHHEYFSKYKDIRLESNGSKIRIGSQKIDTKNLDLDVWQKMLNELKKVCGNDRLTEDTDSIANMVYNEIKSN